VRLARVLVATLAVSAIEEEAGDAEVASVGVSTSIRKTVMNPSTAMLAFIALADGYGNSFILVKEEQDEALAHRKAQLSA
jgi:hypothetical protein